MCIGFWTLEHADYALILCTNRDEFLQRPTLPASWWKDDDNIFAGRDEQAGGTWFGINRFGRVALLTNITEDPNENIHSTRGCLVSGYLSSTKPISHDNYAKELENSTDIYAGFNLLLLDPVSSEGKISYRSTFLSNHGGGNPITSRALTTEQRGYGGMSNGIDGDPDWEKVHCGKDQFSKVAFGEFKDEGELIEKLFMVLETKSPTQVKHRSELRKWIHVDPIRIPAPNVSELAQEEVQYYGTRLSTVLLVRRDGSLLFVERDIWKVQDGQPVRGKKHDERKIELHIKL